MNYDLSKINFATKLIILEFDSLCKKHEVRCLRNNIYQSIVVKDFNHLAELWLTHPRYYFDGKIYCKDPLLLIKSLRYIFREIKRQNSEKGKFNTYEFLFTIYVDYSEKEIIDEIKKTANVV